MGKRTPKPPSVWAGLSVAERDALVRSCRPGDPAADALGLVDDDWSNLDDLGEGAMEDARRIALDFAALIADGAERVVVRDNTPRSGESDGA